MPEVSKLHIVDFGLSVIILTGFVQSSFPCAARSSTTIGGPSQASLEASPSEHRQDRMTINTLPDDALVQIFDFYVNHSSIGTNGWHTLIHHGLDSWENIGTALEWEHHHRICEIDLLNIPTTHWGRFAAAMQKPFPELTFLRFWAFAVTAKSLPDSFLGGSAPLLRHLSLSDCPFPGIPKLLLSAHQLVRLSLWSIPDSGYISPQDLVTAVSVMSGLEVLRIQFRSPRYPASRSPPTPTRSVLPALTGLLFWGVHEYLEDLLAQIEAPPSQHTRRDVLHGPSLCPPTTPPADQSHKIVRDMRQSNCAHFQWWNPNFNFQKNRSDSGGLVANQVCGSSFPLLSTLIQFDILDNASQSHWKDDMPTTPWLGLLAPFTSVNDLRLSDPAARHIYRVLEELVEERVTEFLPALRNIFVRNLWPSESVPKYIEGFVAARRLSGHPVAVHLWE
ncbi:hypothetical protein F5148DRAFT_1288216 [Russula earlei]|uniref:Uncharacterized protein n=1 Tax=Russula earlei TaxID=71964 RepID=A0ACC0U042_9AGAM|nr:hypothetical protein F5148DRAFT_1288216 [Russula earlei]